MLALFALGVLFGAASTPGWGPITRILPPLGVETIALVVFVFVLFAAGLTAGRAKSRVVGVIAIAALWFGSALGSLMSTVRWEFDIAQWALSSATLGFTDHGPVRSLALAPDAVGIRLTGTAIIVVVLCLGAVAGTWLRRRELTGSAGDDDSAGSV